MGLNDEDKFLKNRWGQRHKKCKEIKRTWKTEEKVKARTRKRKREGEWRVRYNASILKQPKIWKNFSYLSLNLFLDSSGVFENMTNWGDLRVFLWQEKNVWRMYTSSWSGGRKASKGSLRHVFRILSNI